MQERVVTIDGYQVTLSDIPQRNGQESCRIYDAIMGDKDDALAIACAAALRTWGSVTRANPRAQIFGEGGI
jgi:hypothetical protein